MDIFGDLLKTNLFAGLDNVIAVYSMMLIRIIAFLSQAPVFSHKSISTLSRIGFALVITALLSSRIEQSPTPSEPYSIIFVLILNIAFGLLLGYVANLLFVIVQAGGEFMDSSMGFSSAQMFDPVSGGQTTIMGKFMGTLSACVFFVVGGPQILLETLANSINVVPIFADHIDINLERMFALTGDTIKMSFILVSPVVLTILVNDLVLGLLSRASPQINAFQISFTIKPIIGITIFLLILPLFFTSLERLFTSPSRFF